jgi:hypothetical protein
MPYNEVKQVNEWNFLSHPLCSIKASIRPRGYGNVLRQYLENP